MRLSLFGSRLPMFISQSSFTALLFLKTMFLPIRNKEKNYHCQSFGIHHLKHVKLFYQKCLHLYILDGVAKSSYRVNRPLLFCSSGCMFVPNVQDPCDSNTPLLTATIHQVSTAMHCILQLLSVDSSHQQKSNIH